MMDGQKNDLLGYLRLTILYLAFGFGGLAVNYFGISLFIMLAILVGSYCLGYYIPVLVVNKWKIKPWLIDVIAWSNIVSWFLPFLGAFTMGFTMGCYKSIEEIKKQRKYLILASISLIALIIHVGSIFYLASKH